MGKAVRQNSAVPPPVNVERYTPAEIIAAFRLNHGNVSATARVLECDRSTIQNYVNRYPEVKAAQEEGVEARIDLAEEKLQEAIADREAWAVQLALRGQGAKRGHAEKSETTITFDPAKLTDEQLAEIAAGRNPIAVLTGTTRDS